MGFLSNLKGNLTGNWATVTTQVSTARRGETITVPVDVTVKEKDISVDAVVLELVCREIVDLPDNNRSSSGDCHHNFSASEELHDQKITVAGPQQMAAGSSQSFTANVQIPAHLPPTFNGRNARVEWSVLARLDMKGNDPDSGLQYITVE